MSKYDSMSISIEKTNSYKLHKVIIRLTKNEIRNVINLPTYGISCINRYMYLIQR